MSKGSALFAGTCQVDAAQDEMMTYKLLHTSGVATGR